MPRTSGRRGGAEGASSGRALAGCDTCATGPHEMEGRDALSAFFLAHGEGHATWIDLSEAPGGKLPRRD